MTTPKTPNHEDHAARRQALRMAATKALGAMQNARSLSEAVRRATALLAPALEAEDAHDIAILTTPDTETADLPDPEIDLPGRYEVTVGDKYGPHSTWIDESFRTALDRAAGQQQMRPKDRVIITNLDRCDYGHDGLTEDQSEALDAALWQARIRGTEQRLRQQRDPIVAAAQAVAALPEAERPGMPAMMPPTVAALAAASLREHEERERLNAHE